MMAGIKGTNTKPEMVLRRSLHGLGFRYKLHDKTLPGKPDIVLPRYNAVIFAHGCFWHGHDCHLFRLPSTRPEFWAAKIARNREVDTRSEAALRKLGWRQAIVWECALKGRTRLAFADVITSLSTWLRTEEDFLVIEGSKARGTP